MTMGALTLAGDNLVVAIQAEHEAASQAARSALEHAINCGRLLAQARASIPHGGWETFVENTCGIAPRTGRLYLRLHANRDRLENRQRVAGLTVREAAKLVAEPRPATVATLEHGLSGPAWYRSGHYHLGRHPSGWAFHVWPHPAGEPWVHLVSLEPLIAATDSDMVAAGPKRGLRSDAIVRILELQTVNKMPPMSDAGWDITSRLVEPEVAAAEPHYNRWLFLDDEHYRVDGLGLQPKQRGAVSHATAT
jgi:hypothetical protein